MKKRVLSKVFVIVSILIFVTLSSCVGPDSFDCKKDPSATYPITNLLTAKCYWAIRITLRFRIQETGQLLELPRTVHRSRTLKKI